jgi:single-stranded DNA-binding protein
MKTVTNAIVVTAPRFIVMADGVTSICSFRVADNHNDEGFTYWYSLTGFNEMATLMKENISKGQRINVSGEVKEYPYVADDGSTETVFEIVVEHLSINSADFDKPRVEDQAEADAIADSTPKEPHICDCGKCYR